MRTIGTILAIVLVIGFGIWLVTRNNNPGIPSTGEDAASTDIYGNSNPLNGSNSTSTDNGNSKG